MKWKDKQKLLQNEISEYLDIQKVYSNDRLPMEYGVDRKELRRQKRLLKKQQRRAKRENY